MPHARTLDPDNGPRRTAAGGGLRAGVSSLTTRSWWPAARRVLVVVFFLVVLGLVANLARMVEWRAVMASLSAYPRATVALAFGLAMVSYTFYCCYDLLARRYTGHTLPALSVVGVGFVAYAFNLSLGAWVGAIALRYRLYARLGLGNDVIARVFGFSVLTNWLGYILLAGLAFMFFPLDLPPDWKLGTGGLRVLGAALLLVALGYLAACCFSHRRVLQIRGHAVSLPSGRMAVLQFLLAGANWLSVAGLIYVLLQGRIDYVSVLSVLLIAAVAGIIARVPAGLGVLEAVFATLLAHRLPQADLLAALLVYRAVYTLTPLLVATALLFVIDRRAGRKATESRSLSA